MLTKDNGGPFADAKLIDVMALVIYAFQSIDVDSKETSAQQAYGKADELIAEKRRREQSKD